MLNPLKLWRSGTSTPACEQILAASDTTRLLLREKARTDRSHLPFSTLRLTGEFCTQQGQQRFKRLVEHCRTRLRITDDLGWLNQYELAVVLPETGAAGAESVAENIEGRFVGEFGIEVFTYPSNWWLESLRQSCDFTTIRGDANTVTSDGEGYLSVESDGAVDTRRSASPRAMSLETVMIRKMPG